MQCGSYVSFAYASTLHQCEVQAVLHQTIGKGRKGTIHEKRDVIKKVQISHFLLKMFKYLPTLVLSMYMMGVTCRWVEPACPKQIKCSQVHHYRCHITHLFLVMSEAPCPASTPGPLHLLISSLEPYPPMYLLAQSLDSFRPLVKGHLIVEVSPNLPH